MRARARMGDQAREHVHARAPVHLLMQHATRMRHIVTSSVAPLHFSTYLINDTFFKENVLNIKCVF